MNKELEIEILKRLESLEEYIQRQIKLGLKFNEDNPNARFAVNRGGFNCSVKHNDLCTNNEPLFIDVPIGTETKINYRQENQLGIHYSFLVEGNDFIIYKNLADGYYYHAGNKVTSNKCNIINKIVQEYEKDNMSGKYTGDAEKQNSGCFEKVLINVPLIGNFKVKYKEPSDEKLLYGLVYEDIVKEFMLLDGVIYHQGAEVTNQCGKKVKQIINDYEAGLAKGEEKKTCTFMFHENARVIDVSPHWSNGVRYTIGNNGNNYVIDRLTNCEFYHGNYLVTKESSEKLKDLIIDYWTNKNI